MDKGISLYCGWLLVMVLLTSSGQVDSFESAIHFSMDFLKSVLDKSDHNEVVSPVSVSTLLSMLQQGARNNTLSELNTALHSDPTQTKKFYGNIIKSLRKSSNSSMIIEFATKAFVSKDFDVHTIFKKTLMKDFNSEIAQLDFSRNKNAVHEINSWVENETHGRVKEIVSSDTLDSNIKMLLVNAIFFKGIWKSPFKPEKTHNSTFRNQKGNDIKVPTMHRMIILKSASMPSLGCKWVELPFEGNRFFMYILLPYENETISSVVQKLAENDGFMTILKSKGKRNVNLALPKFKLSSQMDLVKTLHQVGIHDVFSPRNANLGGISDKPLSVSQILHQAQISIDETGGSAASSTGVVLKLRSALDLSEDVTDFIVNRPFLAFIVDKVNMVPLFAARVNDPTKP